MKKMIYFALLIAFSSFSFAQKDLDLIQTEAVNYPFGIGPFIFAKAGVNANDVPDGIKNGIAFVPLPDFGITGYIPFGSDTKIGASVDLAYSTYGFQKKFTGQEGNPWTESFSYITLSPHLHIWGFLLGFGFGIPLGGEVGRAETEVKSDDMSTMVEIRIGAMLPIVQSHSGRLNIVIMGGYFLTGQFSNTVWTGGSGFNTHPASLGLGINYMFNLTQPNGRE